MIKEAIISLSRKENIRYETAKQVMDEIMGGEASAVQMSAYLTALAMKGETIEEITASAEGIGKVTKPWFLAGGIGTDNIKEAMALKPYGIDVSSKVETDGYKDREKVDRIIEQVHTNGRKG